jgi:hypothetical protein
MSDLFSNLKKSIKRFWEVPLECSLGYHRWRDDLISLSDDKTRIIKLRHCIDCNFYEKRVRDLHNCVLSSETLTPAEYIKSYQEEVDRINK